MVIEARIMFTSRDSNWLGNGTRIFLHSANGLYQDRDGEYTGV